jgi:hypothetical protein
LTGEPQPNPFSSSSIPPDADLVARDPVELAAPFCLDGGLISGELSQETAEAVAQAARQETGASHALAVLIEVDDGPDRMIPVEDALPEEIEAMRRADEKYARGECVRLEDLRHELGVKPR